LMKRKSMGIRHKILLFLVTCGFIGYLPFAPGTFASLFGAVLLYVFPFSSLQGNLIFVASLIVVSIISVNWFRSEVKDPGYIVIDELAGMYVTMTGHRPTILNILAGFVLFRIFDVMKPFPINKAESLARGYGVVADDVIAGIFANLALVVVGRVT
jgi:phosphatidylglycerophosphatase A